MIVGAGGGFGILILIFDVLVLMSLGASFCYLKWRGRYKRNQQPVPPLKMAIGDAVRTNNFTDFMCDHVLSDHGIQ